MVAPTPAGSSEPGAAVVRRAGAWAAILLAALVAAPWPGLAQSSGSIAIDANADSAATVDLRADAGKTLVFTLNEADFGNAKDSASMKVRLVRAGSLDSPLEYALQQSPDGFWATTVPVDTPDLVAGTWTASFFAYPFSGTTPVKQRTMTVTLADSDAPRLLVLPLGDPARLGPGDALEVDIQEEFLRAVTIRHPGIPQAARLEAPYRLAVDSLPEGLTNVTVRASDRAGQVSEVVIRVDRDTVAPLLNVSVPEVAYVGVPFAVIAQVTERSQHTVRFLNNGSAETRGIGQSAKETTTSQVFVVTAPDEGQVYYTVEAIDLVGNRATSSFTIPVVAPPTDVRVVGLSLAPGASPFVGEPAKVVATLEQVAGVTSLPVAVTFSTSGQQHTVTVTLPAAGNKLVLWNVTLPPGPREVKVHVEGPAFANETNPGNENATATIETFLGSARVGDDLFLIRADSRGLPSHAVDDAQKAYALKLEQTGRGVVYKFTLPGNVTGTWDPLSPRAADPEPSSSSSSTTTGSKGAPSPGFALALLVVALAALAQRRR